jgi:4-hydroxy-tetrahydrodipicolinate reductase
MSALKIGVMGAAGRMGLALIQAVAAREGAELASAVETPGSAAVGRDAGELAGLGASGVIVGDDPRAAIEAADAILDFTRPDPTLAFARQAADLGKIHIIGTTGFTAAQDDEFAGLADRLCMVKAGNMSLGVNLLTALTRKVAAALDEDFDIEILEMHHKHKVDAPSGTALMLGQAAAEGRGISLGDRSVRVRDGETGPRRRGDIGFATLRGGSVVGEHSAIFAAEGERVVLSHIATDRGIFARGAVAAATWAKGRPPGLYSMLDVLGLSDA